MKHTILIIALLWALGASGQIYIDSYRFGAAPAANLLLDDYPNAAAAYSLRKLRTAYTGNCIEVRRSNDNTTLNIGFSGNYLDTAALKTFCGSNSCFVRTWYDQSLNANNATMTTDNTKQPQIVNSGAIIYQDGEPALSWDGSNDRLTSAITQIQSSAALCVFYVYASTNAAAANTNTALLYCSGIVGSSIIRLRASSTGILSGEFMYFDVRVDAFDSGNPRLGSSTYRRNANTQVIESDLFLQSGTSFYQNNSLQTLNLASGGATTTTNYTPSAYNLNSRFDVGSFNDLVFAPQRIQEMIIYPSNISSDLGGIHGNINSFYNAY